MNQSLDKKFKQKHFYIKKIIEQYYSFRCKTYKTNFSKSNPIIYKMDNALPQNPWTRSNHEKTSHKLKMAKALQNISPILIKGTKVMKNEKRQRNCHRLEKSKHQD